MKNTKIEWADHSFNAWIGCTKVSVGCANCYAEADFDKRRGFVKWGAGMPRHRTSDAYWRKPLAWNKEAEKTGIRNRVFCGSLMDVFDDEVPMDWRVDLLMLIDSTPHLDWLLLTKRPENISTLLFEASNGYIEDFSLMPNVWLGTSVENQEAAETRIPELLKIPAKVRFLSCEPLLGELDLSKNVRLFSKEGKTIYPCTETLLFGIDWVICGGESGGRKARPMHPDWARGLRDQYKEAGVPFMFKQWGEYRPPQFGETSGMERFIYADFTDRNSGMWRAGKKESGRLLDGVEHNEFPELGGSNV